MSDKIQKNVFGEPLEPCSSDPLTGWFRDGCATRIKMIEVFILFVQK